MTELEERLTNELSKFAEQYARGAEAAGRAGRALGRAGAAIGRSAEVRSTWVYQVEQDLGGAGDTLGRASAAIGRSARVRAEGVYRVVRAHGRAAGDLERTCREINQGIQRTRAVFGRGLKSMQIKRERGLLNGGAAEVADGTLAASSGFPGLRSGPSGQCVRFAKVGEWKVSSGLLDDGFDGSFCGARPTRYSRRNHRGLLRYERPVGHAPVLERNSCPRCQLR